MQALTISDLQKVYPNGIAAVKGINLSVEEGDFFALLGPNGAGKSTTIGIVSGLVNKTAGKVQVFGHDIDTHLAAAKSCLGLMPQEFNFNIFETVLQIVVNQAGYYGIPRKLAFIRAEKYLSQLGLWVRRNESARMLSGGMKRRLMIARSLMHEPKVLILDEPTAGVDIELRRTLWEFLRTINQQGITIILTTHYLEEAESLCKNIAIIDKGQIIENTSMKKLLAQLNQETFILYLKDSINDLPEIPHYTIQKIDDTTLSVDVIKGQSLNDVFSILSENSIQILSMRNKVNRLEEMFLHLVSNEKRS